MIDVDEFDKLVSTTYGRTYSFQQQGDCKSRGIEYITVPCEEEDYETESIPEKINGEQMGVSFKAWLERDVNKPVGKETEKWEIDLFWKRNFYPHISMIINDLHKKGLLDAGKYAIKIDW